jgi:hypothetical protein
VQTQYLSPADAGSISKCLGQLLTAGTISHREYAIGQCLLWRVRKSGQAIATASYTLLGRLAHVSRKIVAATLRKLHSLGLIEIQKARVRVCWGGSVASRQATSSYRLIPSTEFPPAPTIKREVRIEAPEKDVREAQCALARIRLQMERRLMGRVGEEKRPGGEPGR